MTRLECHEEWEYDEENGVQRLSDLRALCTWCHKVKHWSRAATKLLPPPGFLKEVRRKKTTLKEIMQDTRRAFDESMHRGDVQSANRYLRKGKASPAWKKDRCWQFLAYEKALYPRHRSLEYHFLWVNDCDPKTLVEHVEQAAETNYRRSQRKWHVDFGGFCEAEKPDL